MDQRRKQTRTPTPSASGIAASAAFVGFAWLTNEPEQVAFLGAIVCFCVGYAFVELQEFKKERRAWDSVLTALPVPFALATEPGLF